MDRRSCNNKRISPYYLALPFCSLSYRRLSDIIYKFINKSVINLFHSQFTCQIFPIFSVKQKPEYFFICQSCNRIWSTQWIILYSSAGEQNSSLHNFYNKNVSRKIYLNLNTITARIHTHASNTSTPHLFVPLKCKKDIKLKQRVWRWREDIEMMIFLHSILLFFFSSLFAECCIYRHARSFRPAILSS